MKNDYIVVIDSGIGGLSTLAACLKQHKLNYYFIADNKNLPYGTHNSQEIQSFLTEIIVNLKKKCDFKIVILACNTATTTSIEYLRNMFQDLAFIGTEPAIKLAYNNGYKHILALTTPATAKQQKFIKLKNSIPCDIKTLCIDNLAENIEQFITNKSIFSYAKLLRNIMKIAVTSKSFDCIVLGCTHYVFLREYLSKFTKIKLFDGNAGVQKQLTKTLSNMTCNNYDNFRIKFDNTLNRKGSKQIYKKILSQILANKEILW